jgi:heparanase
MTAWTRRATLLIAAGSAAIGLTGAAPMPIHPATLKRLATVDDRYQSYNIEMVEVTGGRFWAPYGGPAGEVYRQRPPLDLTDPRLVAYARHLGPAYLRVSGTWSNNTYLPAEGETVTAPPPGFMQVLTRQEWRNVVAFSRAVDAPIVTSFAVSQGVRGPDGRWRPDQAQRLSDLTRAAGGRLAAAEFFNEPNMPGAAQAMPKDYHAADYAADFRVFRDWARHAEPHMVILGPGGVGEGSMMKAPPVNTFGAPIASADMLAANPGGVDAVSYHFYGTVSQRCEGLHIGSARKDDALSPAWLDRTLADYGYYAGLRDRYAPGRPMWNTETGQAACGGSPWASTFLDTFRYLNQLGALAQKGVQVVMHNTLAASDYALLDRDTMTARPNYWGAVLWRRLMDRTVLESPRSPAPALRLYAQCLRDRRGGVAVLALNTGDTAQALAFAGPARAWLMTGQPVDTRAVTINGHTPGIDAQGNLTGLDPVALHGRLALPAQSIAFVALPQAGNPACAPR